MDIKIIVAAHKKYRMPKDKMYIPVQVGAEGNENIGYTPDNTGDNISSKNRSFSELTGLYWAWKNLDCDALGLVQYRRYFKGKRKSSDKYERVLSHSEAEDMLKQYDIVLTKKRKYYIQSIYKHYANTLYIETLDKSREVIAKKYPEYLETFDKCMKHTHMHAFNMFIMKKDLLDKYCDWLFDILFEIDKEIDSSKFDSFHARYPGRVSELLLDVWIEKNGYTVKEVPFMYMERINWPKKIINFITATLFNKKYKESF